MSDISSDKFSLPNILPALLSVVIGVFFSSTVVYSATNLSLSEAWQRLELKNDALKAARADVRHKEHKQEGRKDLYLPSVSLSANYVYLDDDVELSSDDLIESIEGGEAVLQQLFHVASGFEDLGSVLGSLSAGLTSTIAEQENFHSSVTATWPVYTGGRIGAAQDIAAASTSESRQALRLESLKQFEQLIRHYFGAVLAAQVVQTRTEVETGLKKHKDHAFLLEQQGQIARVERMQSEASYDKAVVERKKAQRDLEIARVALTRVLKSDEPVIPADTLFLADSLPGMELFIKDTLINYPGLETLTSKRKQVEGLVKVEKGKYLPTVALLGNYSIYEEDDLAMKLAPDWFVGVGVSVPLVDRSGRGDNVRAAQSTIERIDHLHAQAESDLSVLVEKTYRQVLQAVEEYEGLGSSRSLAEEALRLRTKAFSQGLATSLDVVDAELFLAGVKTQRAAAMYNYDIGLAKLLAVSGKPHTFFSYQNNKGIEEQ